MLVYCDTSMLLRLIVEEPGSALAAAVWDGADALATSRLADVEVRATLRAAVRSDLLSAAGATQAEAAWNRDRLALRWVEFPAQVADHAARLAERHPIRASDAIHLASALLLRGEHAAMAVFERRLAAAAVAEGLRVLPRYG